MRALALGALLATLGGPPPLQVRSTERTNAIRGGAVPAAAPIPLFPTLGGELFHATALQLLAGTTTTGTPLTVNGAPTLVPATGSAPKRAGVTGFTASNYFEGTGVQTGALGFTYCVALNIDVLGNDTLALSDVGSAGANGWITQNWSSSGGAWLGPYDVSLGQFAYFSLTRGWATGQHIICGGYDLAGTTWRVQVDGVDGDETGIGPPTPLGTSPTLDVGAYLAGAQPFTGTIYEVYISTNSATDAALTALYNAAVSRE